jgi:phosphatidylserine synthase 2
MQQFSPHSWSKFEWGTTKTFDRYLAILGIIFLELACEVNAFYLKHLLWIPVHSPLNALRLFYYFFICLPAVREAYAYLTEPKCKKLGIYAWMATVNILTELVVILKFSRNEFNKPFPDHIIAFWVVFSFVVIGYAVWKFAIKPKVRKHKID